ncbi:hypothetical protein EhV164_00463 [Emiliania huxleyi virus 164]|nr:hypothetical protein EhV164_00463 [Emiliania huxleyi virus 164]UKZ11449.1 hypothetical protein EhVM1_000434 [Emiliania huxleyi virus M1]
MFYIYVWTLPTNALCCNSSKYTHELSHNCAISHDQATAANEQFKTWESNENTKSLLYENDMPVSSICKLSYFGKHGAESKMLCNVEKFAMRDDCTVISIGSENKWDFEYDIFNKTNCRVETFDCTGTGLDWSVPKELQSRVRLHLICIGNPEWRYVDLKNGGRSRLTPHANKQYVTMSWETMLKYINLPPNVAPTVLKIDCEGCELDLFNDLIKSNMHHLLPDQMSVELHYPYDPNKKSIWNKRFSELDKKYPPRKLAFDMHNIAGFTIIGHQYNQDAPCCQEVLFARTRCMIASNQDIYDNEPYIISDSLSKSHKPMHTRMCKPSSPWNDIESFIKVSLKSEEEILLKKWVNGYVNNMPCFHRLHVISSDVIMATRYFNNVPNTSYHTNSFPRAFDHVSEYIKMQWHVTWADNYTTAKHILFWDVDSIPLLPIRYHHYFDTNNRPFWYFWSYSSKSWISRDNNVIYKSANNGYGNLNANIINSYRNMDFMTFFPVVIPRQSLMYMRNTVMAADTLSTCFDNAWIRLIRPSHVDLIGKSILLHDKHLFSAIHCSSSKSKNKCSNLYRTVEHVKHPIQGASHISSHIYGKSILKYVDTLVAQSNDAITGGNLPMELWHYKDTTRSIQQIDETRRWLFTEIS